ncbi:MULTISPECIES: hypothetical protein [Micromonospora]|uniref:hypothetical protein n=1 Tax=Micromonospora TaxID=1873 RepID=UPI001B3665BE|nr:hypothetical protein [Micromonospora sp. C81]MBQ1037107.1 hypothetical protein [Micromonospora sp. C81]WTI24044.1 hypothetical protein OG886_13540 [Micromonospora zamorensis]
MPLLVAEGVGPVGGSRPAIASVTYLILAALLVAVAVVDGLAGWLMPSTPDRPVWLDESAARIGAMVLALVLIWRARRAAKRHWRTQQRFQEAPGKPTIDPGDRKTADREIIEAMVRVSKKYPSSSIRLFGQMLVEPGRYQVRVTDEVEPVGECLRVTVSTTYTSSLDDLSELRRQAGEPAIPTQRQSVATTMMSSAHPSSRSAEGIDSDNNAGGSGAPTAVLTRTSNQNGAEPTFILVPMITATKGTMMDNVDTSDGGGSALPFLSQEDARGVVAHVLQAEFEKTFGQNHRSVLYALLRLVFRQGRVRLADAHTYFDRAVASVRENADEKQLTKLRRICAFLVRNYVIVAEAPPPTGYKWVLRYTKTIPVYGRVDTRGRRRRVKYGLQPNSFVIPLNLPFTTNSYHFRMNAGPNSYVKAHYVQSAKTGSTIHQDEIKKMSNLAYLRVRHHQALPYAHLYTRRFDTCKPKDLVMQIIFDEVPPGALGLTRWLATLSAFVITMLAFVVPSNGGDVSGDVLAFLLAISPVAASFVGYSMEKLQRSSLTTFVGLLITGLTSVATAILYVREAPEQMIREVGPPVLDPLLGHLSVNVGVLFVGLAAIMNAMYLRWRLKDELTHYLQLLTAKNTTARMFR